MLKQLSHLQIISSLIMAKAFKDTSKVLIMKKLAPLIILLILSVDVDAVHECGSPHRSIARLDRRNTDVMILKKQISFTGILVEIHLNYHLEVFIRLVFGLCRLSIQISQIFSATVKPSPIRSMTAN